MLTDTRCPYIDGRTSTTESFVQSSVRPDELDRYLRDGFRHFSHFFFMPVCRACSRCVPLRIPLGQYSHPSSARRLFRRNSDLNVYVRSPFPSSESYGLYKRHLNRFGIGGAESYDQYIRSFFSPMNCNYQLSAVFEGRLVAVMHLDVTASSVSAVYCYYDESEKHRSLGTFAIYRSIELALQSSCQFLYLGYYVRENRHMRYKERYRPSEILTRDGWVAFKDADGTVVNPAALEEGFPAREIRQKQRGSKAGDLNPR